MRLYRPEYYIITRSTTDTRSLGVLVRGCKTESEAQHYAGLLKAADNQRNYWVLHWSNPTLPRE